MDIEAFLQQYVEEYLFKDLKNMAKIKLEPLETAGAASYPMIATTLAGMELLGWLLYEKEEHFDRKKGDAYFHHYWNDYLAKENGKYPRGGGVSNLIRGLARHGLAHASLAKPGVWVTKGKPQSHMSISKTSAKLTIDAIELFKDFENSYWNSVKPCLADATKKVMMQARLDEMIREWSRQATELFRDVSWKVPIKTYLVQPTDTSETVTTSGWPTTEDSLPYSGGTPPVK